MAQRREVFEIELSKTQFLEFLRIFQAPPDMQRAAAHESSFQDFYDRDSGPVEDSYGLFHLWLLDTLGFKKEARQCREWRRKKLEELEAEKPSRPYSRDDPDWMHFEVRKANIEHGRELADKARTTMMLTGRPTLTAIPGRIVARLEKYHRRPGYFGWAMLLAAILAAIFAGLTLIQSYPWGRHLLRVPDAPPPTLQQSGGGRAGPPAPP